MTGGGAIVGIIDSGVDISHRAFRRADGTTRIKFLLDLSNPGDLDGDGKLDGPDEFGGTLYTEAQINQLLAGSGQLPTNDPTGHGTLALSIAAGSDRQFPGMAPAAPLIVVKATRRNGTLDFESADLLSALSFIDQKAAELRLPYVVNMSLGTSYGPHDGKTAEEVAIDELVGSGVPGKAVVVAAGNSGEGHSMHYRHFQGTAFTGIQSRHILRVRPYSQATPGIGNNTVLVDIWYEGSDHLAIAVTAPDGKTKVEAAYGRVADFPTPAGQVFIGNLGGPDPRNGATEAVILLYDESGTAPMAGNWTITVRGEAIASTGVYHGWLVDGASVVAHKEPFLSHHADNDYLIARPATAENAIAVGSFARHDPDSLFVTRWTDIKGVRFKDPLASPEDISTFSSTGPTRDGRDKPEVTAPGEYVIGAVSQDALPWLSPSSIFLKGSPPSQPYALIIENAPDRVFGVFQGTSFSAPVVTGLVARLLSARPSLDAVQVRNMLLNSAVVDSFTGAVPNHLWGHGKADLRLVTRPDLPLPSPLRIMPDLLPTIPLGQAFSQVFVATGGTAPFSWAVVDGSLPPGLALADGALLAGTPSGGGSFRFTLRVRDSSVPVKSASLDLDLVVAAQIPLEILTLRLPPGDLTSGYASTLQAAGGTPPYAWSLRRGLLPSGLTISPRGVLAGDPAGQGEFFFTVAVADAAGATALRSLSLEIVDSSQVAWQPVGLEDQFVRLIRIDPKDGSHLAIGVSTFGREYRIFESFDAGRTWANLSLHTGLDLDAAATLSIDPATSQLWALSIAYRNPYRFDRTLQQWLPALACRTTSDPLDLRMLDVGFDAGGDIFMLPYSTNCPLLPALDAYRGFLESTDGGVSWKNLGLFPDPRVPGVQDGRDQLGKLSVFAADRHHLFASWFQDWRCCSEPVLERMYRSDDGGGTWAELPIDVATVSLPYVSQTDPADVVRAPWNPDDTAGAHPIPWRPEYPGSSVVERSTDGGANWAASEIPGQQRLCHLDRSVSMPSLLLGGTIAGVFASQDTGATWKPLPLPGITPNLCEGGDVAIDPTDPVKLYVGLKNARIASSLDGGASWRLGGQHLLQRISTGLALSRARPSDLLMISGAPFVSRSAGSRWTLSPYGVEDTRIRPDTSSFPVISEADPDLFLFVGETGYNIYRSADRGVSWEPLQPQFGQPDNFTTTHHYQPSIRSLIVDPFNAKTLLARVLIFGSTAADQTEGMWRSDDAGTTWRQVAEPEASKFYTNRVASSIAFAHDTGGHVYAGGLTQLFESSDTGTSWHRVAQLPPSLLRTGDIVVRPALSDAQYIYVISGNGAGAYDARAATWSWKIFPYYSSFGSLAVDPQDRATAYLGRLYSNYADASGDHFANNHTGGIDKTTDGGASWTRLTSFSTSLSVIGLETDPTTPGTVYASTLEDGAYKSVDGGATWLRLDNYGVLADVVNVAVKDPNHPERLFAATRGFGVQLSTDDGQTFLPRNQGLGSLDVTCLAFDPDPPEVLYAGTDNGLFKSLDGGGHWLATALAGGLITDISVESGSHPRKIHLTTYDLGVVASDDQGQSFSYQRAGLASPDLTSIAVETRAGAKRLWVTMRGGDGVAVSDDLGASWRSAAGSGLANRNVNHVAVEPGAGRVWLATDGGIAVTADGGMTWADSSAGLPLGVRVTSLSTDPDTGELFASLSNVAAGGVFRGGNTNGTWSRLGQALPERRVRRLSNDGGHPVTASSRATTFYASTTGSGLFRLDIPAAGGAPALAIATAALPPAAVDNRCDLPLAAAGGAPPYRWTIVAGDLPPGVGLDGTSGALAGTPVTAGLYPFTLQVADAQGSTARRDLSLLVLPAAGGH